MIQKNNTLRQNVSVCYSFANFCSNFYHKILYVYEMIREIEQVVMDNLVTDVTRFIRPTWWNINSDVSFSRLFLSAICSFFFFFFYVEIGSGRSWPHRHRRKSPQIKYRYPLDTLFPIICGSHSRIRHERVFRLLSENPPRTGEWIFLREAIAALSEGGVVGRVCVSYVIESCTLARIKNSSPPWITISRNN